MRKSKSVAKTKTLPWDPAVHLKSDKDVACYLEAVLEDGDAGLVAAALGDRAAARARPTPPLRGAAGAR